MPNTPDIQTLGAVNVTSLLTTFPKQITEREYIDLGLLTGTEHAVVTLTGLGKHPKTGINPVMAAEGVQGAYALLSLVGVDGGTLQVCSDGMVYTRTAAGAINGVVLAAAGAEPDFETVMGIDDVASGQEVPGSAAARVWRIDVERTDADSVYVQVANTTPTPDQVWEATVSVTGMFAEAMHVVVGNPRAFSAEINSNVESSVRDAFLASVASTYDTTDPVVSGFTIPATDTDYEITISTFTVTEESGQVYRAITMTDVAPAVDSALWSAINATPATYTIPLASRTGTGTYTLYGWAKDGAGNVSASVSDTIDLTIA